MRKIPLHLIFLSIPLLSFGQTYHKVVQIQPQKQIYLPSWSSGGVTRQYFKVELPQNTVEWYYVVTTAPNNVESPSIELAAQLSKLVDNTEIISIALSSIAVPHGSGKVDVYLIQDAGDVQKFLNKDDYYGNGFSYIHDDSQEGLIQGPVQVKDVISGTCYLCIKNPSNRTGVYVTLEIAAIVDETANKVWSKELKDTIYNRYYTALINKNVSESAAKELANCVVDSLTTSKTPEEIQEMSKGEISELLQTIAKNCTESMQGGPKTEEQNKATTYGNLGWKAYQNGDIDRCMELSKKALGLDSTLGWVKANLGLCCLIKGDESASEDYYVDAISSMEKNKLDAKRELQAVIQDIKDAVVKHTDLKGYKEIEDLLDSELKKY